MTFKEHHRELQELVRELAVLRQHNLQIKAGAPQAKLLMFAESALVVLVLERFVRIILGDANENHTLYSLLQQAVKRELLELPWKDQEEGIKRVCSVRNTLLHGNYEQAARDAGCDSVTTYFKTVFASEVEAMFKITQELFKQIDPETGKPVET